MVAATLIGSLEIGSSCEKGPPVGSAIDLIGKWMPGRDSLYAFTASCAALLSLLGGDLRGGGLDLLMRLLGAFGTPTTWCGAARSWLVAHDEPVLAVAAVVMLVGLVGMKGFEGYFTRAGASWAAATATMVETGHWAWWAGLVLLAARAAVVAAAKGKRPEAVYVMASGIMAILYAPIAFGGFLIGDTRPPGPGSQSEPATGARVAR